MPIMKSKSVVNEVKKKAISQSWQSHHSFSAVAKNEQ